MYLTPRSCFHSFLAWISSITEKLGLQLIHVDGKTAKGSYDREGKLKALHSVSAGPSEHGLVLGQQKVDSKSNEITAVPLVVCQDSFEGLGTDNFGFRLRPCCGYAAAEAGRSGILDFGFRLSSLLRRWILENCPIPHFKIDRPLVHQEESPMIAVRSSQERGVANFGWLNSKHTFSFGNYYDPNQMGFSSLRVINEDRVKPGRGFETHGHRDMEIISYVLEGALEHKDSIGNGSVIRPGDVQRMSAGTGIFHSEFNSSKTDPVHFLQIWILPAQQGLKPSYEQKTFSEEEKRGTLRLVGSQDGRNGSITIHQDVDLYTTLLKEAEEVTHRLKEGRRAWVQVTRGSVQLNGQQLDSGDGAAISQEEYIAIKGTSDAEVLLFDIA